MRGIIPAAALLVLALLSAGCAADQTPSRQAAVGAAAGEAGAPPAAPQTQPAAGAQTLPPQVQKAVTVAKAIEADPDAAEAILEKNGLTQAEFEGLLYEIAADANLSRLYEEAMSK